MRNHQLRQSWSNSVTADTRQNFWTEWNQTEIFRTNTFQVRKFEIRRKRHHLLIMQIHKSSLVVQRCGSCDICYPRFHFSLLNKLSLASWLDIWQKWQDQRESISTTTKEPIFPITFFNLLLPRCWWQFFLSLLTYKRRFFCLISIGKKKESSVISYFLSPWQNCRNTLFFMYHKSQTSRTCHFQ